MEKIIAWIAPGKAPAYSARPLLGLPCRAHVERALGEAGIPPLSQAAAPGPGAALLWVREDAPCLSAQTLCHLASLAAQGTAAFLLAQADAPEPGGVLAAGLPGRSAPAWGGETAAALTEAELRAGTPCPPADAGEALAVENAAAYAAALSLLGDRIRQGHMARSVLFLDPERTLVEADVTIGEGTLIYGGNVLQGRTAIGAGCTLYPNNRMDNARVGDGTTAESSVLLDCAVGSHTTVGPFAFLRPDSRIGDRCRIGDFVEVKNSTIGDGTKVSHLTYVGDSDLGRDINLGCGVVFVNYDGKKKHRCTVEDHAFIGCNCNLVAPVHIGKNAYLAAGGTIVEDVPGDALYVARARGVVKEGWASRRREQGKL